MTGCSVVQLSFPHLNIWQLCLFHNVAHYTGKLMIDWKRISVQEQQEHSSLETEKSKCLLFLLQTRNITTSTIQQPTLLTVSLINSNTSRQYISDHTRHVNATHIKRFTTTNCTRSSATAEKQCISCAHLTRLAS